MAQVQEFLQALTARVKDLLFLGMTEELAGSRSRTPGLNGWDCVRNMGLEILDRVFVAAYMVCFPLA